MMQPGNSEDDAEDRISGQDCSMGYPKQRECDEIGWSKELLARTLMPETAEVSLAESRLEEKLDGDCNNNSVFTPRIAG